MAEVLWYQPVEARLHIIHIWMKPGRAEKDEWGQDGKMQVRDSSAMFSFLVQVALERHLFSFPTLPPEAQIALDSILFPSILVKSPSLLC